LASGAKLAAPGLRDAAYAPIPSAVCSADEEFNFTAGNTIKGIVRQDTWNIRRSSPDEEHDGRSEREEDQGIDGPDLLSGDEGEYTT
jgi:hypothetical protein